MGSDSLCRDLPSPAQPAAPTLLPMWEEGLDLLWKGEAEPRGRVCAAPHIRCPHSEGSGSGRAVRVLPGSASTEQLGRMVCANQRAARRQAAEEKPILTHIFHSHQAGLLPSISFLGPGYRLVGLPGISSESQKARGVPLSSAAFFADNGAIKLFMCVFAYKTGDKKCLTEM